VNRTKFLLKEWGGWVCSHIDYADEYGESILFRLSQFRGYTDPEPGSSKILCPDMPPRIKRVDIAVNKLSDLRKNCLKLHYCAPLRDDGHPYTRSQLSRMLRINKGKFKAELWKAQKDIKRLL
jgi:hypothetical protein